MDRNSLAKRYIDNLKNGKISAEDLLKLPELVTCPDWSKVEIMGTVNYVSDRTKILYDGVLVIHSGGLYYMKKKVAETLGSFDHRFRSIRTIITVI